MGLPGLGGGIFSTVFYVCMFVQYPDSFAHFGLFDKTNNLKTSH